MKPSVRAAIAAVLVVIGLTFIYHQYTVRLSQDVPIIPAGEKSEAQAAPLGFNESEWPAASDKVIVMAKIKTENTDWVAENLPDWQHAIYEMDDPTATLHPPKNKGREAMAYLTYIIDHYHNLPSTMVFLHSHRDGWPKGWHTDAKDYDNVKSVQKLKIDYVQKEGYANLRCLPIPGCPDEIQPFRDPPDQEKNVEHVMPEVWKYMFGQHAKVPSTIGVACCSQFAVSRDQVQKRPIEDFQKYQQWLLTTNLTDDVSGRVIEYLWHIYFGQKAVHCPSLSTCYCNVYGLGC